MGACRRRDRKRRREGKEMWVQVEDGTMWPWMKRMREKGIRFEVWIEGRYSGCLHSNEGRPRRSGQRTYEAVSMALSGSRCTRHGKRATHMRQQRRQTYGKRITHTSSRQASPRESHLIPCEGISVWYRDRATRFVHETGPYSTVLHHAGTVRE
jgi:hypothetical protein